MQKKDWIAVFKKDWVCKVFQEPGKSTDVLYWIERKENGKFHTVVSTGNKYALRNFRFFDTDMEIVDLIYENEKSLWKCISLNEQSLNYWGSHCIATIQDIKGKKLSIAIHGRYSSSVRNQQASISDYLYPKAILCFLYYLSKYDDWVNLKILNPNLFNEISNVGGIPPLLFEIVDEPFNNIDGQDIIL